ncbi:hypothetical protein BDY17DRAFT_78429 [Neohortaea acidophila]|uniref:Uncharacterized protein n=1 Tax=Neohortaea acidophila TaxID=245834 RepID=A0A6A6Q303_9PEZI|nr:uncharacterized protein BDY17DRAFT_78429 [Neohortaea acidophila]KAF2486411.1 hypothetical protein BDY17DRAFT_78429 [Neohortaea acidophila]
MSHHLREPISNYGSLGLFHRLSTQTPPRRGDHEMGWSCWFAGGCSEARITHIHRQVTIPLQRGKRDFGHIAATMPISQSSQEVWEVTKGDHQGSSEADIAAEPDWRNVGTSTIRASRTSKGRNQGSFGNMSMKTGNTAKITKQMKLPSCKRRRQRTPNLVG